MQSVDGELRLSATDLVGRMACARLTELDRAAALGLRRRPHFEDVGLDALMERGRRHEADYVARLEAEGFAPVRIEGVGIERRFLDETLAALRAGERAIVQGALKTGRWVGRADVLLRVERASAFGGYAYEPLDAKLARDAKPGAVLQLCLYAELLQAIQERAPDRIGVVAPWTDFQPRWFRLAEFAAYFRRIRQALEAALDAPDRNSYPDPVEHCEVCDWSVECQARRRADDHLSLVAGASATQIKTLHSRGVTTMRALAAEPLPLAWKPARGAAKSFEKLIAQARLQVRGTDEGRMLHELKPVEAPFGLAALPAPSPGDVFLDFEGDAFVGPQGLEYLFGYVWEDGEASDWALTRAEERRAFERFMDFVADRRARWPDMHVYHFAPYEPAALKRLAGRYATCEEALDGLLRGQAFVDLLAVVRRGLIASVESYSIKALEPLIGFERETPLRDAGRARARVEAALELEAPETIDPADRDAVESYNRDDCRSARALRDWLEDRRAEAISRGEAIPRPSPEASEPSEKITEWLARIRPVVEGLKANAGDDPAARSPGAHGRWLMAHFVDWHRREDKTGWWEHFRLAGLELDELFDERDALSGLQFVGDLPQAKRARTPVHRYRFPEQDSQIRKGCELRAAGGARIGTVAAIDPEARTIDIKKLGEAVEDHPEGVYTHTMIRKGALEEALLALGEHVLANGLEGAGDWRAARDLILRHPCAAGGSAQREGEEPLETAVRLALDPAVSVLPIQGPPGSGKTWLGAHLICRLVQAGRRVGVSANSHKVIRHLLEATLKAARANGQDWRAVQKTDKDDLGEPPDGLDVAGDNEALEGALADHPVAGGTAWLWARGDMAGKLDVLVIDEAAQMALPNVLAASRAARTLVLLGDPQQLDQPVQGVHPEGCAVSALRHVLGEAETMPAERGLFLEQTRRLHPAICAFTSEVFYAGRLEPLAGLERQAIVGAGRLSGAGLKFHAVAHEGNQSESAEEAGAVARLVDEALAAGSTWIDEHGEAHALEAKDILVISPYNAQVDALRGALPAGARVGTVDKFQGQEAPLVLYSMASSTPEDAPRGMEFLYSLNRLNVATSRARCVSVLVASPALFNVRCRTIEQMRLANAFCRYLELAEAI